MCESTCGGPEYLDFLGCLPKAAGREGSGCWCLPEVFWAVLKRDWDGLAGIEDFLGGGKVCKKTCLHRWWACLTVTVAFCWILSSGSGLWKWELAFTCWMSDWQKVDFVLLERRVGFAGGEEGFGEEREWEKLSGYLEDVWRYLSLRSVIPARQKVTEESHRNRPSHCVSGMPMIIVIVMKKNVAYLSSLLYKYYT